MLQELSFPNVGVSQEDLCLCPTSVVIAAPVSNCPEFYCKFIFDL